MYDLRRLQEILEFCPDNYRACRHALVVLFWAVVRQSVRNPRHLTFGDLRNSVIE